MEFGHWFMAALAVVTFEEELFDRVVPKGQGFAGEKNGCDYAGIFRFR